MKLNSDTVAAKLKIFTVAEAVYPSVEDLAQSFSLKEVGEKTKFELFLISHDLVAELRGREDHFSHPYR